MEALEADVVDPLAIDPGADPLQVADDQVEIAEVETTEDLLEDSKAGIIVADEIFGLTVESAVATTEVEASYDSAGLAAQEDIATETAEEGVEENDGHNNASKVDEERAAEEVKDLPSGRRSRRGAVVKGSTVKTAKKPPARKPPRRGGVKTTTTGRGAKRNGGEDEEGGAVALQKRVSVQVDRIDSVIGNAMDPFIRNSTYILLDDEIIGRRCFRLRGGTFKKKGKRSGSADTDESEDNNSGDDMALEVPAGGGSDAARNGTSKGSSRTSLRNIRRPKLAAVKSADDSSDPDAELDEMNLDGADNNDDDAEEAATPTRGKKRGRTSAGDSDAQPQKRGRGGSGRGAAETVDSLRTTRAAAPRRATNKSASPVVEE